MLESLTHSITTMGKVSGCCDTRCSLSKATNPTKSNRGSWNDKIKTKTSDGEQRHMAMKMVRRNSYGRKDQMRNQGGTALGWGNQATATAVDRDSEESKSPVNIDIERNRACMLRLRRWGLPNLTTI
jgi:hypothetical protein